VGAVSSQAAPILAASPELAAVTASVRDFALIMTERRGRKRLKGWMTGALATGEPALCSFVTGLRADQDAVTSRLRLPWTPAWSKATSTASRCSNGKCTDVPAPICSAAASCSPAKRSSMAGSHDLGWRLVGPGQRSSCPA
jgi:hypothetical protein